MSNIKLFLLLLTLIAAATASAQTAAGTLTGKVTAPNGNAVANAAVTVTDTSTNTSQRVVTGPDGTFSIPNLGPGTYRVEVESEGYKRTSQPVQLSGAGTADVNFTLEGGSVNETVEIKGVAPGVQTDNAELSLGLGTRTVRELPVIDRNHDQLNELRSGVTPPQPALDMVIDPARSRFFSTNGQAPTANMPYLEGLANVEPYRGVPLHSMPTESVQQMNMVGGLYRPERGFTGGTWQNHVTRGGTNDWHGSLFEFHSNNNLRARNFFNIPDNPDPKFVYNQFGGTVGGRLIRDHTFFFGSYEGTYQRGANTVVTSVPTPEVIGGNFGSIPGLQLYNPATGTVAGSLRSAFANSMIPSSRINPTAAAIASYLPQPNQPGLINNYVTNVPARNDGNKFDGRLDHRFNERVGGFLRYGYTNYLSYEGSPLGSVIGAGMRGRQVSQNAIASAIISSPSFITELRLGYSRWNQKLRAQNDQFLLGDRFGSDFDNNLLGINIPGMALIGTPANVPMQGVDNNYNAAGSWSWRTGRHNIKFGADIRHFRSDGFFDQMFGSSGTAFFGPGATMLAGGPAISQYGGLYNSFAAFLLGAPSQVGISAFTETPTYRQWQSAAWVGDTIQFGRLTLDLGLRYDVYSPLEPRRSGGAQFFNPSTNTFNFAGDDFGMHGYRYDLNNIAPRIGLALRATDKTVIRGGYSISYFQQPYRMSGFMPSTWAAVSGVQGTYQVAPFEGQFGPTVVNNTAFPTLQNGALAGNQPVTVVPRDLQTPYVQHFSLGIQQDFYAGTTLGLSYVGSLGRHLPGITELNAARPGTGISGLPFASLGRVGSVLGYDNFLTNNYNSFQANLTRRFAQGLSFTAAYTYGKALGYTNDDGRLLNPFDREANYGLLPYDRKHVLTFSHLWELPFGAGTNRLNQGWVGQLLGNWQINGVFRWDSGTPLTVMADPLLCACPGNSVLANFQGGDPITGERLALLNPAAFSAPRNAFGDAGRGAYRGRGYRNYDLSLFRSFVVNQFKLEFRGEAYNLTNSPRFASPVTNINSPGFGRITNTVNGTFGRQVNLGLRLLF